MPVIVLLTVIASVGLGILAAYLVVTGILLSFRRPPQPQPQPVVGRPRLILVPSQNHASGD